MMARFVTSPQFIGVYDRDIDEPESLQHILKKSFDQIAPLVIQMLNESGLAFHYNEDLRELYIPMYNSQMHEYWLCKLMKIVTE